MNATVILIPVLRRPHRVLPLLESISAATPELHRVVFVCSPEDSEEIQAVQASPASADALILDQACAPGDYARKINFGYHASTEPFIFLGADDLQFHAGWLSAALARMADPRIGVVGTQDLGNPRVKAGLHATHSLTRRMYVDECGTIDEQGKVLHEGYHHNFCDTEFVATAMRRNAWAFAGDAVVEHLHYHWAKSEEDSTYKLGFSMFKRDAQYFRNRSLLWGVK